MGTMTSGRGSNDGVSCLTGSIGEEEARETGAAAL